MTHFYTARTELSTVQLSIVYCTHFFADRFVASRAFISRGCALRRTLFFPSVRPPTLLHPEQQILSFSQYILSLSKYYIYLRIRTLCSQIANNERSATIPQFLPTATSATLRALPPGISDRKPFPATATALSPLAAIGDKLFPRRNAIALNDSSQLANRFLPISSSLNIHARYSSLVGSYAYN